MRHRALITVLIGATAALTCPGCSSPELQVTERLTEEEIVGTWHLTKESLDLLATKNLEGTSGHRYTVTLHRGGSCHFESLLDRLHRHEYVVAPCNWSLQHNAFGNSNLRKKNVLRLSIDREGRTIRTYLNFGRTAKELLLWNTYVDSDFGEYIFYERRDETTSNKRMQLAALRAAADAQR